VFVFLKNIYISLAMLYCVLHNYYEKLKLIKKSSMVLNKSKRNIPLIETCIFSDAFLLQNIFLLQLLFFKTKTYHKLKCKF
jgi:hypothetical protein